jgi:CheY-like chemotaxis protein
MSIVVSLVIGAIVAGVAIAALRARGRERRESADDDTTADRVISTFPEPPPVEYAMVSLRVLVVDDDPQVGQAIKRLLAAHEVVPVTSGAAALTTLASDDRFDAILCDFTMPGMSGVALSAAIAERHPELRSRVVFLLDAVTTPETKRLIALSDVRWVGKPVGYVQLANCVSEVAAQRNSTTVPSERSVTPV